MIDGYPRVLTLAAAVGAGVAGGVFFAFSTFVMRGLGRLTPSEGIAAMQAINEAAPNPWFMTELFGTASLCLVLAVSALTRLGDGQAAYQLVGSALFLVAIGLTIVYHVPRNDALALLDPRGQGAAVAWAHYRSGWTAWNHVRTLTSVAAATVLTLALRAG